MRKDPFSHWATSQDLAKLQLSLHDAGTQLTGEALGTSQRGGPFVFDPFSAYDAGLVTNPNMVIAGSIGVGKSTLIKMLLLRGIALGRSAVIIDPKGEYQELANQCGVRPIVFGVDGWCNPFLGSDEENLALLRTLLAAARGEELDSNFHYLLSQFWKDSISPSEPRVIATLFERVKSHLDDEVENPRKELALLLYRFTQGDLAGLFDGLGEPIAFDNRVIILDLSRQWMAENIALVAISAVAAAQQVLVSRPSPGYLVIDEAWAILREESTLRWLQGSWKLARARGVSHILALHRWSDILAAGNQGSAHRERAAGLLRECETSWLFRQGVEEATEMARALGLKDREKVLLTNLLKGTVLVRYAQHRSVVALQPNGQDRQVVNTDQAMKVFSHYDS